MFIEFYFLIKLVEVFLTSIKHLLCKWQIRNFIIGFGYEGVVKSYVYAGGGHIHLLHEIDRRYSPIILYQTWCSVVLCTYLGLFNT